MGDTSVNLASRSMDRASLALKGTDQVKSGPKGTDQAESGPPRHSALSVGRFKMVK